MIVEIAKKIEHQTNCLHIYARLSNGILLRPQAMIVARGWEQTLIYRGMYRFFGCLKKRENTKMNHDKTRMNFKMLLLTLVTTLFLTAGNADAKYYREVRCDKQCGGCNSDGIVKLGMTLSKVTHACGSYTKAYPSREVTEKWHEWGYRGCPGETVATHEKYLFRNRTWEGKVEKILLFRNWKLYQIFDYGTPVRCPKLPKKFYR